MRELSDMRRDRRLRIGRLVGASGAALLVMATLGLRDAAPESEPAPALEVPAPTPFDRRDVTPQDVTRKDAAGSEAVVVAPLTPAFPLTEGLTVRPGLGAWTSPTLPFAPRDARALVVGFTLQWETSPSEGPATRRIP